MSSSAGDRIQQAEREVPALAPVDHFRRILLGLAITAITYLSFPATPIVDSPLLEPGSVATQDVISPIDFRLPKDAADLRSEREVAARAVLPLFGFDSTGADSSRKLVHSFFEHVSRADRGPDQSAQAVAIRTAADSLGVRLIAAEALHLANPRQRDLLMQAAESSITRILARGVAPTGAMDTIRTAIDIRTGDSTRTVPADSVVTFNTFLARARLESGVTQGSIADGLLSKLLTTFFRPTLIVDRAATELRRNEASAAVPLYRYEVKAQEAIVRANGVVGPVEHDKMRALRAELEVRQAGTRNYGRMAAVLLFDLLIVGALGFAIFAFRPVIYASLRSLVAMALIGVIVIVAAAFAARASSPRPELIPIAVVAITFAVLFDSRISFIAIAALAVLLGGQHVFLGSDAQFMMLTAGVAAVFSVRPMHQRNQAYYSMLSIAIAYALASLAHGLMIDRPVVGILESALYGGVNAIITVPFAMLLLPLAEDFTGIDTYPRLLEWSDLNRPLMRQLSLEAPGTYAHTMTIANLAEAACSAIGANSMLARVGSYYHDIGKLSAPQYFVENQPRGRNPHDELDPLMSASIIRNHVLYGLQLAEKHKVPRTIRAFIPEHHGTAPITYFLEKSTERNGNAVNPDEFRYPGPLPRSAETAVVMLADAVEASARVLNEPTPGKIRDVVDHIVKLRMEQGQLADAPITMQQLDIIKAEFTRVLSAAHHSRIEYPATAGGITAEFAS